MKIHLSKSQPFDVDLTLCCGQTFRWDKIGEWWYGVVDGNVIKIRQIHQTMEFQDTLANLVREYFALDDDLPTILDDVDKDEHINHVVRELKGLRILHQDPWECLVSFICATCKNIVSIKQNLFNLSRRYGEKIDFEDRIFYTFPTPEKLARAKLTGLAKCGLGYRVKYVSETAKAIWENSSKLKELERSSYEEAKKGLLELPGIGQKVADCVLLFSMKKYEAFPVDVWMKRAVLSHYSKFFSPDFVKRLSGHRSISDTEYRRLSEFGRNYFGRYAGYAQEYLYHHERIEANSNPISS
jgi:N-glycosylase/DNA lyase